MLNHNISTLFPPSLPLPVGHTIVMIFGWTSFIVYCNLIYVLVTKRKYCSELNTSFYRIISLNAIGDFASFLHVEFVTRPRKFRMFELFSDGEPHWFLIFTLFTGFTIRNVVNLNFIPVALNRLTAVFYPMSHNMMWTPFRIHAIAITIWIVAIILSCTMFLQNLSEAHFQILPSGVLQVFAFEIAYQNTIQTLILCLFVTLICILIYSVAVPKGLKKSPHNQQSSVLEKRLLICGLCTAIPLLIEASIAIVLMYCSTAEHREFYIVFTEFWIYQIEIMTSLQCWLILLIIPQIWTTFRTNLVALSVWIFCILLSSPVYLAELKGPYFFILPSGILQLVVTNIGFIGTLSNSLIWIVGAIICASLYLIVLLQLVSKSKMLGTNKFVKVERRILLCAVFSTIPLLLEAIRCGFVIYAINAKNMELFTFLNEVVLTWVTSTSSFHCWLILFIFPSMRKRFQQYGLLSFFICRRNQVECQIVQ